MVTENSDFYVPQLERLQVFIQILATLLGVEWSVPSGKNKYTKILNKTNKNEKFMQCYFVPLLQV